MAAVPRAVQMITRDRQNRGNDRVFMRREVQDLIASWDLQAPDSRYIIVSVIGPQSTGKSTLMNKIFQAGFRVLASNRLRTQTTKGIWVAVCNHPRAIVIDTEGSDGIEQQDDIAFENQSALFALLMSDVIIINLWEKDINRLHAGFNTTLTTIFQEMTNHMPRQTKIIFAVRDYDGQGTDSEIVDYFNTRVNEIWSRISHNGNLTQTDYVEIHVELFPSAVARHKLEEFEEKCAALCDHLAGGEFGPRIQNVLPAKEFPMNAADLWENILQNERLRLPSHMVLMSRQICESIMKEILQNPQLLQADDRSSPKLFLIALENNRRHILSQYDRATSTYDRHTADEIKERLETSFMKNNKPAFQRALERERQKFLEKTKKEIAERMKYSLMPNNWVQPFVQEYNLQFGNIIADLDRYHEEITKQKQEFLDEMTCFAQQKAVEIVAERWAAVLSVRNVMIGAAAIGACIGTAYAFYYLVKFGPPMAAVVVKQSLPYIMKALEALRHSLKIILAVVKVMWNVLRSSWPLIANVITEVTTSKRSDTVNEFIDILQGATSADRNRVELLVMVLLGIAKVTQNSQMTTEGL